VTGMNFWHVFTMKLSDRSDSSSLPANSCHKNMTITYTCIAYINIVKIINKYHTPHILNWIYNSLLTHGKLGLIAMVYWNKKTKYKIRKRRSHHVISFYMMEELC
jgi:hypothetical protein